MIKDVTERVALNAAAPAAKQDAESARLAFARSAELIGEFLYSAELLPDGRYVMHAQGPGIAALLGSDGDPADAPEARRLPRPSRRSRDLRRTRGRTPTCCTLNGQVVELRYRLVGRRRHRPLGTRPRPDHRQSESGSS